MRVCLFWHCIFVVAGELSASDVFVVALCLQEQGGVWGLSINDIFLVVCCCCRCCVRCAGA